MNHSTIKQTQIFSQWLSQFKTDFAHNKLYAITLFISVAILFYALTASGNFSETDDVFAFAYRTENFLFSHVSDPRLMLYHMLMRGIYVALNLVVAPFGTELSAIFTMRLVSVISAAFSLWLMFRILRQHFACSELVAFIGVALLGLAYGFWRYAAEAEVYIPAIALSLVVFHLLQLSFQRLYLSALLIGLLAGLSILFYQPLVIPLLFAFSFLLLLSKQFARLIIYVCSASAIVLVGYIWGYYLFWPEPISIGNFLAFLAQRSEEFMVPEMSVRTVIVSVLRSAIALGHDFTSANWIFAWQSVIDYAQQLFPQNILNEEIFTAQQVGWFRYPLLVSQLSIIALVLFLILVAIKNYKLINMNLSAWVILIWLLINGAIIGRLNPGGIEAWIIVFPAIMLLVTLCVIAPSWHKYKHLWVTLVLLLTFQNGVGGMYLVNSSDHDYHQVKGKWVIDNAQDNDVVIVSGDASFTESLRYLSRAKVISIAQPTRSRFAAWLLDDEAIIFVLLTDGRDFSGQNISDIMAEAIDKNGRILVFEDFFTQLDPNTEGSLAKLKKQSNIIYASPNTHDTYQLKLNR